MFAKLTLLTYTYTIVYKLSCFSIYPLVLLIFYSRYMWNLNRNNEKTKLMKVWWFLKTETDEFVEFETDELLVISFSISL